MDLVGPTFVFTCLFKVVPCIPVLLFYSYNLNTRLCALAIWIPVSGQFMMDVTVPQVETSNVRIWVELKMSQMTASEKLSKMVLQNVSTGFWTLVTWHRLKVNWWINLQDPGSPLVLEFGRILVILPLVGQPQPHPTHANTVDNKSALLLIIWWSGSNLTRIGIRRAQTQAWGICS